MKIKMKVTAAEGSKMVDLDGSGVNVKIYGVSLGAAKATPPEKQKFFANFELQSTEPINLKTNDELEVIIPESDIKVVSNIKVVGKA